MRNAYKMLVGKPEGQIPHGRPSQRWEDNIKVGLKETECPLDSFGSGKGAVAGSCVNSNEPSGSIKEGGFLYHPSDLSASQEGLCSLTSVKINFCVKLL